MEKDYKRTFNYQLTHKVMPQMYFSNLDFFYDTILPSPKNMQIFMQNAMAFAYEAALDNNEIEPPPMKDGEFVYDHFQIELCHENEKRCVIIDY